MAPENVTSIRPNTQVLVLNASYEPIHITSWKRAIILLLKEKAAMISAKVIRLVEYVRIPFARINSFKPSRSLIYKRDGHKCQYCGLTRRLTIDHVVPRSRGGLDTWENLVVACSTCNTRKGDTPLEQTGMRSARKPFIPTNRFLLNVIDSGSPEWLQYT